MSLHLYLRALLASKQQHKSERLIGIPELPRIAWFLQGNIHAEDRARKSSFRTMYVHLYRRSLRKLKQNQIKFLNGYEMSVEFMDSGWVHASETSYVLAQRYRGLLGPRRALLWWTLWRTKLWLRRKEKGQICLWHNFNKKYGNRAGSTYYGNGHDFSGCI